MTAMMDAASDRTTAPPPRRRRRLDARRESLFLVGFVLALLFALPMVWAAIVSVMPPEQAAKGPPPWLPESLDGGNYDALAAYGSGIGNYVLNSVIVASITVVGTLLVGTLGGYGFSRFEFPLKGPLFLVILATLMIPFQSILIPLFIVLKNLGLTNSLLGVGLVYVTLQLPFSVFVMRNSFDKVPRELEEAAVMDGAGQLTTLRRVMLPVVMPGVVTIGLFAFLTAWNEFFAALILLTKETSFTLPVLLNATRQGLYGTINWGALQAGVVITMVPCLVFYVLLQRYYVSGLQSGAVKT
jgi:multiple sugar transport system permease protein